MGRVVRIGRRWVGDGQPVYVVAEIGINHNGDLDIARRLITAAAKAGCDAVKLQKRTPELCVPAEQRGLMRETPWGLMSYLDYRRRIELGEAEYRAIARLCHELGVDWFASCWDEPSVDFVELFAPPCYKIQSAAVTDLALLRRLRATGRPLILSTGMSSREQVQTAIDLLGTEQLIVAHSTSSYPCPPRDLNLRMIRTLRDEHGCPIGYSGHEVGLAPSIVAVALGACYLERHITLDRAMWGSDQAASVEPQGFERLVRYAHTVEQSLGDGVKRIYPSELPALRRLRRAS